MSRHRHRRKMPAHCSVVESALPWEWRWYPGRLLYMKTLQDVIFSKQLCILKNLGHFTKSHGDQNAVAWKLQVGLKHSKKYLIVFEYVGNPSILAEMITSSGLFVPQETLWGIAWGWAWKYKTVGPDVGLFACHSGIKVR